jgi:hypothetical protein
VNVTVYSSHLAGEEPVRSDEYRVVGKECVGEFSYWAGMAALWSDEATGILVNVEHDMEFSDDLVAALVECPHRACAFAYRVFPTKLQRYIYCATTNFVTDEDHERGMNARWITEGEEWAFWSSIGLCKLAPAARPGPLLKMFWPWLEHCVNWQVAEAGGHSPTNWHIHWPEVAHHHDYGVTPDHLW